MCTESDKADMAHATDFEVPIYNIWKQQVKTMADPNVALQPGGEVGVMVPT